MANKQEDGNPSNDDKDFHGASNGPNIGSNSVDVSNNSPKPKVVSDPRNAPSQKIEGIDYAGNNGTTEVHHVDEQCQQTKSGFDNSQIQSESNKVRLDKAVHRKVSGYYSSTTDYSGGLRVRYWLAGQSFEFQTAFGWSIVNYFYFQVYK